MANIRCSCGRSSSVCHLDVSHDDLVLEREARGAAGRHVESCSLKAARLISEAESIRRDRCKP